MKKYILSLLCSFIFYDVIAQQPLTKEQKEVIIEKIQGFNSAFKQYSGAKGVTDSTLYAKILEYKDGDDPQQGVANDLFYAQNLQSIDFLDYLDKIDDVYHHQLDVEYDNDNIQVLDCIQTKHTNAGDLPFAFVSVNKTITFQNQKKEVTEVIAVNLNNYKIPDVFFPYDSTYNKGVCYDQITSLNTANPPPVPVSNTKVKYKNAVKQADVLYNSGNYALAKTQYEQIISQFPAESQKNNLNTKLDACTNAISDQSYNKMMNYGNYYYNKGIFNKAAEFYNYALQYKPNDNAALSAIDKCKNNGDLRLVRTEINNAEQLAAADPNNYGKAFHILSDVEPSGIIGTRDYYFMIENLYERNPVVMTEMGYNDDDCENYLNIYRYKLRLASQRENQRAVRNDVLVLLGDIVVSSATNHVFARTVKSYPTWVVHNRFNRPVMINPNRSGYNVLRTSNPYRRITNTRNLGNNRSIIPNRGNLPVKNPLTNGKPNIPGKQILNNRLPAAPVKKPSFFKRLGGQILNTSKGKGKTPNIKRPAIKKP